MAVFIKANWWMKCKPGFLHSALVNYNRERLCVMRVTKKGDKKRVQFTRFLSSSIWKNESKKNGETKGG
jgi:hypothetical protein